jgi:uncharacterized protein YceK
MRTLLLIFLLSGCSTVRDNTTLGDKAVISGFMATVIISAKAMGL